LKKQEEEYRIQNTPYDTTNFNYFVWIYEYIFDSLQISDISDFDARECLTKRYFNNDIKQASFQTTNVTSLSSAGCHGGTYDVFDCILREDDWCQECVKNNHDTKVAFFFSV